MIDEEMIGSLESAALTVRLKAHAPYSNFQVGSAILTQCGEMFVGCNVENASFSLTICAERVAAGTAIASGKRKWQAIAIASRGAVTPCGACRQFLAEFGNDLLVVCIDSETGHVTRHMLSDLLPYSFSKDALA